MTDILALVLPFFGMILLGAVAARLTRQPIEALGWMNIFILYIALPALFFQLLSQTPVEELTNWTFIAGSLLATYAAFFAMWLTSCLREHNIAEATIKGLAASYGNIGYMGPGLALLAFGERAAVPVALIFCFENMLHFIVAPFMMAVAGDKRQSTGALVGGIAHRILLHPFIIATAAGVLAAWAGFRPPQALDTLLDYLAGAAAPCALFAMGVTIALRPLKRLPSEIPMITALKLVVHPAICYAVLTTIGDFPPSWVYTAVLLATLPTATNVFVIAQQYGVWVERASASILVTTIGSIVTLTAILYAIKNGYLPV